MKDFTDITVLIDKSGSMCHLAEDTIGGFNTFLTDQKVEGDNASISLYQFADKFEKTFENLPINEAPEIDETDYKADGWSTSLLDGIGRTVNSVSSRLAGMDEEERPEKVVVVIMTDGYENSSQEFKKSDIKKLVEAREAENWQFIFLGADMDGIADAQDMGFAAGKTMKYAASKHGTQVTHNAMSNSVSSIRGMNKQDYEQLTSGGIDLYSKEIRDNADDESK